MTNQKLLRFTNLLNEARYAALAGAWAQAEQHTTEALTLARNERIAAEGADVP